MGHAEVDNATPFSASQSFAIDEEGRPLLVVLVQATYDLSRGAKPVLAGEQPPASLVGELWGADSATSSYRVEPAFAFMKPATDIALVGHAHSMRGPATELEVLFRIGSIGRLVRVTGDRYWVRTRDAIVPSRPDPFVEMPLCYERAFGGWDRSDPDKEKHTFDSRNPVGVGYRGPQRRFEERLPLPNIEDPRDPMRQFGTLIFPAGVGFLSCNWSPRAELRGTFDTEWAKDRRPLLPKDFDRRFFNAGSKGMIAAGYLRGDEEVVVENASIRGRLMFRLPGVRPPACRVELRRSPDRDVVLSMDTVVVDTDHDRLSLLFRGYIDLLESMHDVRTIALEMTH